MTSSGQAWALIARFSNNDAKNWIKDNGEWWYDKRVAVGKGISPSENADMLSKAIWFVSGLEFKITRSDDPRHTALLETCLLYTSPSPRDQRGSRMPSSA